MRKPNEPMGFEFTPHHFTTEKDLKEIIKAFNDAYEMAEEDIANGCTLSATEAVLNLEYAYGKLCGINEQTDRETAMEHTITGHYRTLLRNSVYEENKL